MVEGGRQTTGVLVWGMPTSTSRCSAWLDCVGVFTRCPSCLLCLPRKSLRKGRLWSSFTGKQAAQEAEIEKFTKQAEVVIAVGESSIAEQKQPEQTPVAKLLTAHGRFASHKKIEQWDTFSSTHQIDEHELLSEHECVKPD